jgi:hypothetical protein
VSLAPANAHYGTAQDSMKKLGGSWLREGSVDTVTIPKRQAWEETWTAEPEQMADDDLNVTPAGWWNVKKTPGRYVGTEFGEAEAKLTAAAPDMARALLEVLAQMGSVEKMLVLRESIEDALKKAGVR